MPRSKKPKGRPPKPLPERVNASPEDLAKAMFALPPDHHWKYLDKKEEKKDDRSK